jgi:hypothetical protein
VVPLSHGGFGETTQYITVNPVINIENVSSEVDLAKLHETVSESIAEGFRRRLF